MMVPPLREGGKALLTSGARHVGPTIVEGGKVLAAP